MIQFTAHAQNNSNYDHAHMLYSQVVKRSLQGRPLASYHSAQCQWIMGLHVATWLCLISCVCLAGSEYISEDPSSQPVATGANVTLTCRAPLGTFVQWVTGDLTDFASVEINEQISATWSGGESQLQIRDFVASEHAKEYSCLIGLPRINAVFTCPANISHARIKHAFREVLRDTTVDPGNTAVLKCNPPESHPAPIITWLKDKSQITDDGSRVFITPSGNLYILNVDYADEGLYQCVALNPISNASRESNEAMLIVSDPGSANVSDIPPSFTLHPTSVSVTANFPTVLECSAKGTPPPSITWRKLGGELPLFSEVLPNGALNIPVTRIEDSGWYECIAENDAGRLGAEALLTVRAPPQVTIEPSNMTMVAIGDTLTLSCTVGGTEPVTVVWYKGVTDLEEVNETPSPITLTHTFTPDTKSDDIYQCLAYNYLGCSRAEVNVSVFEPAITAPSPSPSPSPISITVEVSPPFLILEEGGTNQLQCLARGSPLPTIYWIYVDEFQKIETPNTPFLDAVFTLLSVEKEGHYVCYATNEHGVQLAEAIVAALTPETTPTLSSRESIPTESPTVPYLATPTPTPTASLLDIYAYPKTVIAPEGSAANLTCVVIGGNPDVLVHWTFSADNEERRAITEEDGTVVVTVLAGGVIESQLTLQPVTANHHGVFECTASGANEVVTDSITVIVTASPPTLPPQILGAVWLPGNHIRVTWLPVDPQGIISPLNGYNINWDLTGRTTQSALVSVTSDVHSYVIEGLDPYSGYTVLVWGNSAGGDGPADMIDVPPFITSGTITELVCEPLSPTSANIQWEVEGVTDRFRLTFTCSEAGTTSIHHTDLTSITQDHLLPNCSYMVQVEAVSGGVPSECHFETADGQVDISAEVERLPNGSVRLTWRLPEGTTSDTVKVEVDWGEGWMEVTSGMHLLSSLNNLDSDTAYIIQIRLTIGEWQGNTSTTLPPVPSTSPPSTENEPDNQDSDPTQEELALLYGVIFGTLVVACIVIVVIILTLKYVQGTRREGDKVTNHRQKGEEEFRRRSLSRSSTKSMHKSPLPNGNGEFI